MGALRLNSKKGSVMKRSNSTNAGAVFLRTARLGAPVLALLLGACTSPSHADPASDIRAPEVPVGLQTPGETNKIHFHAYAVGVQIYAWSGTNWVFQSPEAVLFADADAHGEIGIHYAGPTWESQSGSKVVGAAVANAPSPNANSIPLLLIRAVSTQGPGIFAQTTYVQRINTVGGRAPATAGTAGGQIARVPYTAEYFFYRATE
jgi:hypothetical protein